VNVAVYTIGKIDDLFGNDKSREEVAISKGICELKLTHFRKIRFGRRSMCDEHYTFCIFL